MFVEDSVGFKICVCVIHLELLVWSLSMVVNLMCMLFGSPFVFFVCEFNTTNV